MKVDYVPCNASDATIINTSLSCLYMVATGQGKNFFKVREKSGNFYFSQGKWKRWQKLGKNDYGRGKFRFPEHNICGTPIPSYFSTIIFLRVMAHVAVWQFFNYGNMNYIYFRLRHSLWHICYLFLPWIIFFWEGR